MIRARAAAKGDWVNCKVHVWYSHEISSRDNDSNVGTWDWRRGDMPADFFLIYVLVWVSRVGSVCSMIAYFRIVKDGI